MSIEIRVIAIYLFACSCSATPDSALDVRSQLDLQPAESSEVLSAKSGDDPLIDEEGEGLPGYLTDGVNAVVYTKQPDGSISFAAPPGTVTAEPGMPLPEKIFAGRSVRRSIIAHAIEGDVFAALKFASIVELDVKADGSFRGSIESYDDGSLLFFLDRDGFERRVLESGPGNPDKPRIAFRVGPRTPDTHHFRPSVNVEKIRRVADDWIVACRPGFLTEHQESTGIVTSLVLFTRRACLPEGESREPRLLERLPRRR